MSVDVSILYIAAKPTDANQPTYIGLALLAVLLLILLVKAYRTWVEIHDVGEPDSPSDLMASFEKAHAAGELDDEELARVRERLIDSQPFVEDDQSSSPTVTPTPARAPVPPRGDLDPSAVADGTAQPDP
jgi:hypothetical protein